MSRHSSTRTGVNLNGRVVGAETGEAHWGLMFEERIPLFAFLSDIEHTMPTTLVHAHILVDALQVLSLAALPYHNWGFALGGILRALHFSHIPLFDDTILPVGFTVSFIIMGVIVCVMLLATILCAIQVLFTDDEIRYRFLGTKTLAVIRKIMYCVASVAFIPIVSNLVALIYCFKADATTSFSNEMRETYITSSTGSSNFNATRDVNIDLAAVSGLTSSSSRLLWYPDYRCSASMAHDAATFILGLVKKTGGYVPETGVDPVVIGVTVVGVVGILLVVAIAIVSHTLLYDGNPNSTHPLSRPHALLEIPYLLFKVVAVVMMHAFLAMETTESNDRRVGRLPGNLHSSYTTTHDIHVAIDTVACRRSGIDLNFDSTKPADALLRIQPTVKYEMASPMLYYAILMGFGCFIMASLYAFVLPYFHENVNRFRVGVLFAGCCCCILSAVSHAPSVSHYFMGDTLEGKWGSTAAPTSRGMSAQSTSQRAGLGVFSVGDSASTESYLLTLPFHSFNTYVRESEAQPHLDVALMLLLAIVGFVVGYLWLSAIRVSSTMTRALEYLREGSLMSNVTHFPTNLPPGEDLFEDFQRLLRDIGGGVSGLSGADHPGWEDVLDDSEMHFTFPYVDSVYIASDVELATRFIAHFKDITNDLDLSRYQLAYAATVYVKGITKYKQHPGIRLAFACFLGYHASKPGLALEQLQHMRTIPCSLSQRYQCWKVYERFAAAMHVNRSASLDSYTKAQRRHRDAMHHTLEFWQLLLADDVDKLALSTVTRSILTAKQDVFRIYTGLLRKHSGQLDVVASYSKYCEMMIQNSDVTNQCLQYLRDLRELKLSNAVRGAKVKVSDKDSLPLDVAINDNGVIGGSVSQHTQLPRAVLSSITAILLLGCIAFIIILVTYANTATTALETVMKAGQIRSLTSQIVVEANNLITATQASNGTISDSGVQRHVRHLISLHNDFRSIHNQLFSESHQPLLAEQRDYIRERKYVETETNVLNFWDMGFYAAFAIRDVAQNPTNATSSTAFVLNEFPTTVSFAYNRSVQLYIEGMIESESVGGILLFVVLAVAVLAAVFGVFVLFHNTHKMEAIRADIFSLFTLIPRRTRRQLHREARKKLSELERFFEMSTRRKVISLVGAENDEEAEELNFGGSIQGSNNNDSQYSMSQQSTALISNSQGMGTLQGSLVSAIPSSIKEEILMEQRRQRAKVDVDEDHAEEERAFLSDAVFRGKTIFIILLLSGLTLTIAVLFGASFYQMKDVTEYSAREIQIQDSLKNLRWGQWSRSAAAQQFSLSGRDMFFSDYMESRLDNQLPQTLQVLTALDATPEEKQSFFELTRVDDALVQLTDIGLRLALSFYPLDNQSTVVANISYTPLLEVRWPNLDFLKFADIADRRKIYGYRDFLKDLTSSSELLVKPPSDQLLVARQVLFSPLIRQLQDYADALSASLKETKKSREQRKAAEAFMSMIAIVLIVCSVLAVIITVVLFLHRSDSTLLSNPMVSTCLILNGLCLLLCLGVTIASPIILEKNSGWVDRVLSGIHRYEDSLVATTHQIADFPRFYLGSQDLTWVVYYRELLYPTASFDTLVHIQEQENSLVPRPDITAFVGGGFEEMQSQVEEMPVSIVTIPGWAQLQHRRDLRRQDERYWMLKLVDVMHVSKQLTSIAIRLQYNATANVSELAFQTMNATFLDQLEWNFDEEQDSDAVYARYVNVDPSLAFYNTTMSDLNRSVADKKGIAMNIMLSNRLQGSFYAAKALIGSIIRSLSRSALEEDAQQVYVINALLITGLCASGISILFLTVVIVGLFILYTRHISAKLNRSSAKKGGLTGSLGGQVDGQTFLSNTMPLLTLIVIALLGCALIVCVGFYKKTTVELPFLVDYATERSWLVSQSMFITSNMLHNPSAFYEGRSAIAKLYLRLTTSIPALYFFKSPTSTLGVGLGSLGLLSKREGIAARHYFGALTDDTQDKLLFTRNNYYPYSSDDSYVERTNTVSTPPNLYVCNVSYGVELLTKVSVGVGLVYEDQWIDLVRQVTKASSVEQLAPLVASMVTVYDGLMMGLDISNQRYHEYATSQHIIWRNWMIGIVVVLIVIILLNHLILVRMFIGFLAEEESSARLMLHIIPEEARDANKQIAAFLDNGQIRSSGDDLNEAIASMSTLPVLAIDHMGLIVRFTHAAEEAFGYSSAEVIGRNIKMLMPEEYASLHDTYLSNYRRTKVKNVVDNTRKVKAKRKSGEIFPIELSVTELKISDSESYFIGFARDLTAQVEIMMQDRLNKNIIEMNGDPIVMIDSMGLITQVNEAACTVFNFTTDELLHENVKMLMPSDVALNHDGYLLRYRQTGVKHVIDNSRELQAQRKNGELFHVRLTVKEIRSNTDSDHNDMRQDLRGGTLGTVDNTNFIAFISDVTELHAAQEQNDINDLISNLSPIPIVATTSDGMFLKFSKAAEALFGYKATELIRGARNVSILCDPSIGNHDIFLRQFNRKTPAEKSASRVLNTTRAVLAMKKDGSKFPANIIVREVSKKGMDSVLVAYIFDISTSRGVDDGHQLNKAVMYNCPIPVMLCSAHGDIVATNSACTEAFGYEALEVVGRPAELFLPFLGDLPDRSAGISSYCATLRSTLFTPSSGNALQSGSIARSGTTASNATGGILGNTSTIFSHPKTRGGSSSLTGFTGTTLVSSTTTNGQTADDRRAHQNNRIKSVEVLGKRKDGEVVPIELTLREVLQSDDGPVMYFAFLKDISKSQEARKRFVIGDTMAALSTVPIISIDPEGIVDTFSPASEQCFGYAAADVIGENVRMLMPDETAANHNAFLKRYFDTGVKKIIDSFRAVTARRRNGQLFSIELSVKEIKRLDGTTSGFVGYARDLSRERLLAEATIIGHKSKDLSIIPILEMTTGGDILYSNRSLCDKFGFRLDELLPWSAPRRKKGKRGNRDDNEEDHQPSHMHITSLLEIDVAELYRRDADDRRQRKDDATKAVGTDGEGVHDLPWGYENAIRTIARHKNGMNFDVEVTVVEVPQFNFKSEDNPSEFQQEGHVGQSETILLGFIRSVGVQLQLEQANQTIDTITDLSLIPIVAIDHRGVIIKYSLAAENAFGYPAAEVLGNNVKMLMPPEVSQKHDGYLRAYHKTGLKTVIGNVLRHEAKRKDGTRFPIELAVKEIVKHGQHSLFISYLRDVSDDTALERAMGLSSMVIEQCMVPIIVISRKGIITTFNNAACSVFGYSAQEAVGQNVSIIMTEQDARYHDRYLKAYAQTGVKNAVDNVKHRTAMTKHNKAFPVEITVKEVVPSSGDTRKRYFVSFVRDLTGEIQLKNASRINDVIANVSPIPLIGITDKGIMLRFNSAAESAFGYTTNEVLGKNVKMLMPEEIAKRHDSYLHRCAVRRYRKREQARTLRKAGNDAAAVVAENEGVKFERFVYGRRRDGTQFPAELMVGEVVKAGHDSMYVGYIRDATYKFQAQHDQKISETAIMLSPIPVIAIDTAGRVMSFNQAAEECFHYDADEVIGRNVRMLMGREVAEKHDDFLRNYLKTGVKRIIDTTRDVAAKAKNGRKFPAKLNVREIKEADRHYFLANLKNMSIVSALEHASSVNDSIVEMSSTAIVCISKRGLISKFSRSASEVFGYSPGEVLGKNVKMLMPLPFSLNHDGYIQRYLETGNSHILGRTTRNLKGLRKDGTTFHAEICVCEIPEVTDDDDDFNALRQSAEVANGGGQRAKLDDSDSDDDSHSTIESMSHVLSQSAARRSHSSMARSSNLTGHNSASTGRSLMSQGGFIASIRNITDRLARLSETAIIQNAGEVSKRALVVIDGHGIIQRLNIAACQLFKYSKEELVGQNVKMLMPTELAKFHDSYLSTYMRTNVKHIIGESRRVVGVMKGGVQVQLALNIEDLSDVRRGLRSAKRTDSENDLAEVGFENATSKEDRTASKSLFLAYIEDVNLKEELSYAPGLAATLTGLIPQPIVIIDKDGIIQRFNKAAEQVFEFSANQVIGRNVSILMPEETQRSHDRFIKQYLASGERRAIDTTLTLVGETKSGTQIYLAVSIREVKNENDILFVGVLKPIDKP